LYSTGLGQRPVAGCCECGDEPSGSCATELVITIFSLPTSSNKQKHFLTNTHILTCNVFISEKYVIAIALI
jgi:hypothetical protein